MPVVVTGAAGFIGGMLTTALAADGAHVVAVDRRPVRVRYPGVVVLRADLLDRDQAVESALHEADAVYHLAGRSGTRDGGADRAETEHGLLHRDNVIAAAHVLAAVPLRTPLVVASSCAVYGGSPSGWPSHEDDTPNPLGGYGRSKLALEWLCAQRAAAGGAVAVARPFTVAGEGQRPDMAMARWIDALRSGRPLRIYGSPWRTRDVTDVRDVVRSLRMIIERGVVGAINIGSGAPRSLADLAIAACRAVGAPSEFLIMPARPDEPTATYADTRRHERLLGFRPITDLDTLVRRQVAACLAYERATLAEETRLMHGGAGAAATTGAPAGYGGAGPTRMVERMMEARLVETRTVETPFESPETRFTDVALPDDPFAEDPFPEDGVRVTWTRESDVDHPRPAGPPPPSTPAGGDAAPADHDDPTEDTPTRGAFREHADNTTDAGDDGNEGVPELDAMPTHTLTVAGLETIPGGAADTGRLGARQRTTEPEGLETLAYGTSAAAGTPVPPADEVPTGAVESAVVDAADPGTDADSTTTPPAHPAESTCAADGPAADCCATDSDTADSAATDQAVIDSGATGSASAAHADESQEAAGEADRSDRSAQTEGTDDAGADTDGSGGKGGKDNQSNQGTQQAGGGTAAAATVTAYAMP